MIIIAMIAGIILGIIGGSLAPIIPYTYSSYLSIAILAALDTVFGGIVAILKHHFNITVFVSGFFGNAILAILLVFLGERLNVDIYIAAIVVFVTRMFNNLSYLRRYYLDKFLNRKKPQV